MDEFTLNPSQKQAVETTEGFVRVIAGAGSGKTRALSMRFAYLVNELGILPGSILCVSFTNKSANEMRNRIRMLTGDSDTGYISTFHGLCNTILLEESHKIQYPKSFLVIDNADIDEFLKSIYEERDLSLRDMSFSKARDMIEMKKTVEYPEYYRDLTGLSLADLKRKYEMAKESDDIIFYGYLYYEKKNFALDYNDLIILTLHIFEEHDQTAAKWQERLEYIMIDEFQDIDALQYRLMKKLCAYHKNLFVVGDPDQTIYTWRGASVRYLLDFDKDFPGTQTIFLNENYRSTPQILKAANLLIGNNQNRIDKKLISMVLDGAPVHAFWLPSVRKQAESIAAQIETLVGRRGYDYGDIAILYRAHYVSRALEDVFIEKEIPYTIYSGVQFFSRAEIKDALSYIRMLVYRSDLDFLRTVNTPKRNIGKTRIEFLKRYALAHGKSLYESLKDNLEDPIFSRTQAAEYIDLIEQIHWKDRPASEVLCEILDLSGYERAKRLEGAQDRLDNLAELKQSAEEYEQSAGEDVDIEAYLRHIVLYTNTDRSMKGSRVKMMTVHTAKGLEFPVVILPDFDESIFPSRKTRTPSAMEEERRLAFVAMTRAQEKLLICGAAGQNLNGANRTPSRFLLEIEPAVNWNPKPEENLLTQTRWAVKKDETPENRFQNGDVIEHKVFGQGVIMDTDESTGSYLIHFDKLNTTRRLSWKAGIRKVSSAGSGLPC